MELTPEERRQQQADAEIDLEPHCPGRGSKLEAHRVVIEKMRCLRWPYRRIAEWLLKERDLIAYPETIRSFCRVRGIVKGPSAKDRSRSKPDKTPSAEVGRSKRDLPKHSSTVGPFNPSGFPNQPPANGAMPKAQGYPDQVS